MSAPGKPSRGPSRKEILRSLLASSARAWRGTQAIRPARAPRKLLVVFDRESDPDCRLLRELLTELHLDALIQPCPIGGRRFVRKLPQGASLPHLVDPDLGINVSGLQDCLKHLLEHYADASWAATILGSLPMRLSSRLASRLRGKLGEHAQPSRAARKPLQLYSFESSPFSRLVRERLCELELPWVLRSFGKEQLADWGPPNLRFTLKPWAPKPGGHRERMLEETGQAQVPYLIDPNIDPDHEVALFESARILEHLDRHYAKA